MLKHLKLGPKRVIRAYFGPVFLEGQDGSHYIFAQGRVNSSKDKAQKVIVMVKSRDNGKNWTSPKVIFDPQAVIHEIVAFQNQQTGRLGLMFQVVLKNFEGKTTKRKMVKIYSDDKGKTWSKSSLDRGSKGKSLGLYQWNKKGERFVTFQPTGMPFLIQEGPYRGRMVMSGYGLLEKKGANVLGLKKKRAVVALFSENGGETWEMGVPQTETIDQKPGFAGESTLTELSDGTLLMIVRPKKGQKKRFKSYSYDGGVSWTPLEKIKDLAPVPVFQSLTTYKRSGERRILLLSMPQLSLRMKGSVYFSFDEGESWKRKTLVWGFFDYSDIKALSDGRIVVTYSRGGHGPLGVNVAYFPLEWLLNN